MDQKDRVSDPRTYLEIYKHLTQLAVGKYISKKKGGGGKQFSYISWADALHLLTLELGGAFDLELDQSPCEPSFMLFAGRDTRLVSVTCTVHCKDGAIRRTCIMPVLASNNKAVSDPDAFDVNRAIQRATAKVIAYHGLGLQLYTGEDLPLSIDKDDREADRVAKKAKFKRAKVAVEKGTAGEALENAATKEELQAVWAAIPQDQRANFREILDQKKEALGL